MAKLTRPLICVVTSQNTWQILRQCCFNFNFRTNRMLFDLAVVFNGDDESGIQYVKSLIPEYLFVRPNLGLDLAAFDHVIKNTPLYDTYFFLHDDHWFADDKWLFNLTDLIYCHDIDVLGNIVDLTTSDPRYHELAREHHFIVSSALGYGDYQIDKFSFFIQGLAGVYRKKAIECLLMLDGIPHIHNNDKQTAYVCEKLHSFLLIDCGMKIAQIPPGYEQYLKHRFY